MVNWEPVYTISSNTTVREHLMNVKKLNQSLSLSPLPQHNVTQKYNSHLLIILKFVYCLY